MTSSNGISFTHNKEKNFLKYFKEYKISQIILRVVYKNINYNDYKYLNL